MNPKKRVIIVGRHYTIEPLGILHLLGLARAMGWEARVFLAEGFDFEPLFEEVRAFKPDMVGFSIWTGYHLQAFAACDEVKKMGIPVVIGGPHATYFSESCAAHADWVCKGSSFRTFRRLLQGELPPGVHFDDKRMAEGFPVPARDLVYERYRDLAESPIKSMMCSEGCPFHCTYCYAPHYNEMYGGFELNVRPVDQLIDEALAIKESYPLEMFYFQDDIFGFDLQWLQEFVTKWKEQVKIPWHCQIRLELTRNERRLDLFRDGGCTGITLAIESGNDFLRRHVLFRGMSDDLIIEGIRKIQVRGMTLRTEQILAVPFSDIQTDLETLKLNNTLAPEMAWTSILAPYGGTNMGKIASRFGFYDGNNDDLQDTFFERSVLRHVRGGPASIEGAVNARTQKIEDHPLLWMHARQTSDGRYGDLYVDEASQIVTIGTQKPVGRLEYLTSEANNRYSDQAVILQRLFDWFSKVPQGYELAGRFVELQKEEWTWDRLGLLTRDHLERCGYAEQMVIWERTFLSACGTGSFTLPAGPRENPFYFTFLPSGPELARQLLCDGAFDLASEECFRLVGRRTRHHIFDRSLYKVVEADAPIARP